VRCIGAGLDQAEKPLTAQRKDRLDLLAVIVLVACCAIWGLSQVVAKLTLVEVPPLLQSGLRSSGAALLLLLWSRARGLSVWGADGTGRAGLLAGLIFAVEFGCIFVGLQYTTASRMSVFLYLAPFVVALGMPMIARNERLSALQMLGLVIAFSGVVWAYAEGFSRPAAGNLQWLGDALGMAGAVLWALTTLLVRGTRLAGAWPEKTCSAPGPPARPCSARSAGSASRSGTRPSTRSAPTAGRSCWTGCASSKSTWAAI
jgi:drug/metabolite transporter (DMT)-like permease